MTIRNENKGEKNCCGGPAVKNTDACCVKDETAKASGGKGCGCSDKSVSPSEKVECCN